MRNQEHENTQALSDFVSTHNLRDRFSNTHFNALVDITTAKNKLVSERTKVRITFDGYNNAGTVSLAESSLDPYTYPIVYEARWQDMDHIDNHYLLITGNHTSNPAIGAYTVKIIPLGKVRDED